MSPDIQHVTIGLLEGIVVAVAFLLALFIGFCVIFNFPKLRPSNRNSMVIKSLDERVGEPIHYLPPGAPRGTVDQLAAGTRHAATP